MENKTLNKKALFNTEVDISQPQTDALLENLAKQIELLNELKAQIYLKKKPGFLALTVNGKYHYFSSKKDLEDFRHDWKTSDIVKTWQHIPKE